MLRPSSARSPSVTSMMTAGSVRGKCIVLQAGSVQRRMCPASSLRVGAPHNPQKRWRECQNIIARASARSAPSLPLEPAGELAQIGKPHPDLRRSPPRCRRRPAPASAACRAAPRGRTHRARNGRARRSRPRKTNSPRAEALLDIAVGQSADDRTDRLDGQDGGARLAAFDLDDEVVGAPHRDEQARRIEHPGADPIGFAAAQAGALKTRRGIIIGRSHA